MRHLASRVRPPSTSMGKEKRGHACLARVLPGKPRELAIESLRIFQVRAMSNALVHRFFGMWNTGQ